MRRAILVLVALSGCDDHLLGPTNLDTDEPVTYDATWLGVQQLFVDHCVRCHAPDGSNFDLVSTIEQELSTTAGTSTQELLVVPGDAEASVLWQAVSGTGGALPMPIDTVLLPDEVVEPIRQWIEDGAEL